MNYLLIVIHDSLTCTSFSDPAFHYRNVCDNCSVHKFLFIFVCSNSIYEWSTFFLQKTRVICFKLVLFRLYITYIYLHKKNTSKQVKQCIETAETVKNMVMTWCIIEHVLLHTIIIIFFDSVLKQKMTWLGRLGTYWLLRVFYYRLLYYSKKKTPKLNRIKKATIVLLFADKYFILWKTQINYYSVRVKFFNAH